MNKPATTTATTTAAAAVVAVFIPSTQFINHVTYYQLTVTDYNYQYTKPPFVRYKQLIHFHSLLYQQYTNQLALLLSNNKHLVVPTNSLLSSFRKNSTSLVALRQRDLATYLTALIQTQPFRSSTLLLNLLQINTLPDPLSVNKYDWMHQFHTLQSDLIDIRKYLVQSQQQPNQSSATPQQVHQSIQLNKELITKTNSLLRQVNELDRVLIDSQPHAAASSPSFSVVNEEEHEKVMDQNLHLSSKERTRRNNLILSLHQQVIQVQHQLNDNQVNTYTHNLKDELILDPTSTTSSSNRVLGHNPPREIPVVSNPNVNNQGVKRPTTTDASSEILTYQQSQIESQDKMVSTIGSIVNRLKNLGHVMHEELATQHQMLDDTQSHMDRVSSRIRPLNRQIKKV